MGREDKMILEIDDNIKEQWTQHKTVFFEKVTNGYRFKEHIEELRKEGYSDDAIFLIHVLGGYVGLLKLGYDVCLLN